MTGVSLARFANKGNKSVKAYPAHDINGIFMRRKGNNKDVRVRIANYY